MGLLSATIELVDDLIADATRIARHGWQSPVPYLGFGFGGVIVAWLLLGRTEEGDFLSVAYWSENPEGMRNLLWSLATVAAGAAGLYGLSLAARRTKALDEQARIAEQNRQLSEQAQITDRFTRAVEQLGHENRSVRLGAIYALERIAEDSERDSHTILETLAAYVREQSPWPPFLDFVDRKKPPLDVVAAIVVLCRALPGDLSFRLRSKADLRHTDLRGLDLIEPDFRYFLLDGARFDNAKIPFARFGNSDLQKTSFEGAELTGADFTYAFVSATNFLNAQGMHPDQLLDADMSEELPVFTPAHVVLPE